MAALHLENFIGGEYVQARTDRRTAWSTLDRRGLRGCADVRSCRRRPRIRKRRQGFRKLAVHRDGGSGSSSSRASAAPQAAAARTPGTVTVGYSAVISSADMPAARQSKIALTGTRVPAITAWPCITWVSVEIISVLQARSHRFEPSCAHWRIFTFSDSLHDRVWLPAEAQSWSSGRTVIQSSCLYACSPVCRTTASSSRGSRRSFSWWRPALRQGVLPRFLRVVGLPGRSVLRACS
jgi:hypothetical protein